MALVLHARRDGDRIAYRLFDTVDKRYIEMKNPYPDIELDRVIHQVGLGGAFPDAAETLLRWRLRADQNGTSLVVDGQKRTVDDPWADDSLAQWRFQRPRADSHKRSEIMVLHLRSGLIESFALEAQTMWIDRLSQKVPGSSLRILSEYGIVPELAKNRFAWYKFPKDGWSIDDPEVDLGYRDVPRLRGIIGALRAAWKGEIHIDRLTDEGEGSSVVRARFCVL